MIREAARWRRPRGRINWPRLIVGCLASGTVLWTSPPARADEGHALSIGVVIDVRPRPPAVVEFERLVIDSLRNALAGAAARVFVIGYSNQVRLVEDWSPADAGLEAAAAGLSGDEGVNTERVVVLNDALADAVRKLGSSADGGRKGLIVIGEGNDAGSQARFAEVSKAAQAGKFPCLALLIANHRSQVGRVRQFGFDLYSLARGTGGRAYDLGTNPRALDRALEYVQERLIANRNRSPDRR